MSAQAGERLKLTVLREAPFGYFLGNGDRDLLLHRDEVTRPVEIGEQVEVSLYHDRQNRLAATMHKALIGPGEMARLNVVDVAPRLGVYLDWGLKRNLLLPKNECPLLKEEWPRPGDAVYVVLERDKRGRAMAVAAEERDLLPVSTRATQSMKGSMITGWVYKLARAGVFAFSEEGYFVFIHRDEMRRSVRLGEKLEIRAVFIRDDGRINGSLRPRKEIDRLEVADQLLQLLRDRGGAMPYSDETPADILREKLGISKAAFKRAIGKLLKDGLVIQENGWTYLKK
jgi:hypothetical protein